MLAVAYAAGIWWLSDRPAPQLGRSPWWSVLANAVHYPLFGGLALLVAESLRRGGTLSLRARVSVVAIVLAYGIVDELHQSSTLGRTPDAADVAIDGLGALGFLLWWWGLRGPGDPRRALRRFLLVSLVAGLATVVHSLT